MKPIRLVILCEKETKIRFKEFAAKYKNYEEALNALLDIAEGRRTPRFL